MRFYKYRPVGSDLAKDHALDALINSYAIFSGRKNFNDLFDSKIDIPRPQPRDIEELLQDPRIGSKAAEIRTWVADGRFTPKGLSALDSMESSLNELIDSYPIYSLSGADSIDPLWAHYASCHAGFCIEFEFPEEQPKRVIYQEHIESIPLLEFIKGGLLGIDGHPLGERIHRALHVKTSSWSVEEEYRWTATNDMGRIPKGERFIKIKYDPRWVKAVIFGCRASDEMKAYIRKSLPFATQFKQAVERKDYLEILPLAES